MQYSDSKFVMMRYGHNSDIKDGTIYFTNDMNDTISPCDAHKDLGITMTDDAKFDVHISNIIKKAKQKIGWFCRSFRNREIEFMRKMYVSYIRPQLEYCSVLWGPPSGPILDKIEKVQCDFLKLVPSLKNLSYSEKLKRMKITSMERRFDRYRILYIKKMLLGKVSNIGYT